jgi:hypothetical protein
MEASDLTRRMGDFYLVASEVLRDVPEITDQQVKHWILNPFLVSLGWDPHDKKQVYLDFPLKAEGVKADYALLDSGGQARLLIDVRKPKGPDTDSEGVGKLAKGANAPLVLVTNGQEYALWFANGAEPATPLFILGLKELSENAEALLGLTVEYRLSDTGVSQLRRSAIRQAVLQILEENSEKTFDAMVSWVQSQVSPGSLDETTDHAIREATMMWLNEEHHTLPAFAPVGDAKKHHELRATTARDWEAFPRGPPGTFQYRFDTTKTLDIRQGPKEVKESLRLQGLRTPTSTSFGGFYYALRQRAGLSAGSKS